MIRAADVNMAMIQQAAEELEVGVPIRAWEVQEGELVLHLAYGSVARWAGPRDGNQGLLGSGSQAPSKPSKPWRFVEALREDDPRPVPSGSLKQKTRQELLNVAREWGFQSESAYVAKAEFVEALEWLRAGLENGGSDNG